MSIIVTDRSTKKTVCEAKKNCLQTLIRIKENQLEIIIKRKEMIAMVHLQTTFNPQVKVCTHNQEHRLIYE